MSGAAWVGWCLLGVAAMFASAAALALFAVIGGAALGLAGAAMIKLGAWLARIGGGL